MPVAWQICDDPPSEKSAKLVEFSISCPSCFVGQLRYFDVPSAVPAGRMLHRCDNCGRYYAVLNGPYPRTEMK